MKFTAKGAYNTVTIGTSASLVVDQREVRTGVVVYNNGSATIYLGTDSSVTTSNGLPVAIGASGSLDGYMGPVYAISGTASQDVRYLEIY